MVIRKYILLTLCTIILSGCASLDTESNNHYSNVFIEDFTSSEPARCKSSDINLSNAQVKDYFERASEVKYSIIHNHYNLAPCQIEGTLHFDGKVCNWSLDAAGIGYVECKSRSYYLVCESCLDIFPN